jgi:hypothetical protein
MQSVVSAPASARAPEDGSVNGVVLVAYYFPPHGSAGVFRPLRFVRGLSARGWRAFVVTMGGARYERYDPGLLGAVPSNVEVSRVKDRDLWKWIQAKRAARIDAQLAQSPREEATKIERTHQRPWRRSARGIVRRMEGLVYYPDPARFWIRPAVAATVAVCQRHRPRAILVTGGPWSAFMAAREASKRTGVPYVLDFRDSWTLTCNDEFEATRPRWAVRHDRELLDTLFQDAQAVIFRYESEAQSYWQAYTGIRDTDKIHIIPNGYDGSVGEFHAQPADRCTILYTGTVVPYRTDTFFDAVATLKKRHPADATRLRIVFVGEGTEQVQEIAAARDLADIVVTSGPVPSAEVNRLQKDCHALLLLGVKEYQGYELCGSKVFGYLKAARPIVGVLPSDESKRVLDRVGVSTVANIDDPTDIIGVLRHLVGCWSTGSLASLLPNRDACVEFSSVHQVDLVERALHGLPPDVPFVPGRVAIPDSLKGIIGSDGWLNS